MTEFQILSAVKNNGGYIDFAALINLGKTDTGWEPKVDQKLVEKLIADKVLSGKTEAHSTITFGKEGHLRYNALKQLEDDLAKQMTDKKSEKKKDRRFQLFNTLLGAAIGSILTLLMQWISTLF